MANKIEIRSAVLQPLLHLLVRRLQLLQTPHARLTFRCDEKKHKEEEEEKRAEEREQEGKEEERKRGESEEEKELGLSPEAQATLTHIHTVSCLWSGLLNFCRLCLRQLFLAFRPRAAVLVPSLGGHVRGFWFEARQYCALRGFRG